MRALHTQRGQRHAQRCPYCLGSFRTWEGLRAHVASRHPEQIIRWFSAGGRSTTP